MFKHLGAFITFYQKPKERPDLQKEFYSDCKLFVEVKDKNCLKNEFKLVVNNICANMSFFDIITMNGIVTIGSLASGHHTVFLSDVMKKYEIIDGKVVLTIDVTKYHLIKEIFMQVSTYARSNATNEKMTRRNCGCGSNNNGYKTAWGCCSNCDPQPDPQS